MNTTVDLDSVEAFEPIGMATARARKAATAFNKSTDNRMGRMEADIRAVKSGIESLQSNVKHMDVRIELHTWMLSFIFAGFSALIIEAFFH